VSTESRGGELVPTAWSKGKRGAEIRAKNSIVFQELLY